MKAVGEVIAAALLTAVLLASVRIVMRWAGLNGYDPYRIDMTSEGP